MKFAVAVASSFALLVACERFGTEADPPSPTIETLDASTEDAPPTPAAGFCALATKRPTVVACADFDGPTSGDGGVSTFGAHGKTEVVPQGIGGVGDRSLAVSGKNDTQSAGIGGVEFSLPALRDGERLRILFRVRVDELDDPTQPDARVYIASVDLGSGDVTFNLDRLAEDPEELVAAFSGSHADPRRLKVKAPAEVAIDLERGGEQVFLTAQLDGTPMQINQPVTPDDAAPWSAFVGGGFVGDESSGRVVIDDVLIERR